VLKPEDAGGQLEGYLSLGRDTLQADNRRYFAWNPPRQRKVLIVAADAAGERFPASWFFEKALPNDADLPWSTQKSAPGDLADQLANPGTRPEVVIVASFAQWTSEGAAALLEFVRAGGQALVTINSEAESSSLNALVLNELGVTATGARFQDPRETRFDLLAWVDFDHPLFVPFSGSRFNDFSSLRFYNHWLVDVPEGRDELQVLARFDDDSPALIECAVEDGRVILWPYPVKLEWTNLPKSARFIPFLHETLAYLTNLSSAAAVWQVGDRIPESFLVMTSEGVSTIETPDSSGVVEVDAASAAATDVLAMRHAGFFRTRTAADSQWRQVYPVNVSASEGDPEVIESAEFELKLATAPILELKDAEPDILGKETPDGFVVEKEYGLLLLAAVFAFLLLESWYMSWLKR
jgi:hypothetical protein